jgi:hypothetical protein
MDDPAQSGALQSGGTPYRFIDTDTPDAFGVFTAMASLGTDGSSIERGLEATFVRPRDPRPHGERRVPACTDASVHTIVVSDETDGTDPAVLTESEFVTWYATLAASPEERTFSSVVDLDLGADYAAATAGIGGIRGDIDDTVYARVLDELGIQAAGLPARVLSVASAGARDHRGHRRGSRPRGRSRLPLASGPMDANRNSVTFVAYLPGELARIILHYQVQELDTLTLY